MDGWADGYDGYSDVDGTDEDERESVMRIPRYTMTNIMRYDPDSFVTEPTAETIQAFRRWVAAAYVNDILTAYLTGELTSDESPHNENGTSNDVV